MSLAGVLITLAFIFLVFNDIRETSGSHPFKNENPKEGKTMDEITDEESKKRITAESYLLLTNPLIPV